MMRAGYHRVSVVRGGFAGLLEAGVALAPKETATDTLLSPSGEDSKPT